MKYNFDKLTNRKHSSSLKWDVMDNELPMWVADMDFEVAPEIVEALHTRVSHKIFGYNTVPDRYFKSIQTWWNDQHHVLFESNWMMFCTGVVPAISSIVRKLTTVGEKVLIQAPVYNIFYNSIINNGRQVLSNDLLYKQGTYEVDYEDLERKLSDPQTTLMILCNPHNPIGKIWDKETLIKIGHLCKMYQVIVLSDEIHCDIVTPGRSYIPFASTSLENQMNSITCVAPTKAFNLAGLQTSCIIVANEALRNKVWRGINTDEVAEPNSFSIIASITAFEKGKQWLQQLCAYIANNKQYAKSFIQQELPFLHVVESDATYLLWVDCSSICEEDETLVTYIKEQTGLYVSKGSDYGFCGTAFIRMNIACPMTRLKDGLERLCQGIQGYKGNESRFNKCIKDQ